MLLGALPAGDQIVNGENWMGRVSSLQLPGNRRRSRKPGKKGGEKRNAIGERRALWGQPPGALFGAIADISLGATGGIYTKWERNQFSGKSFRAEPETRGIFLGHGMQVCACSHLFSQACCVSCLLSFTG